MEFNQTTTNSGSVFLATAGAPENLKFYSQVEGGYVETETPPTGLEFLIFEVYQIGDFITDLGVSLRWSLAGANITALEFDFPLGAGDVSFVPNILVPMEGEEGLISIPVTSLPNTYDTIISPVRMGAFYDNGIKTRPKDAKGWLLYEGGVLKIRMEAHAGELHELTGCSLELRYQQTISPVYF